VKIYRNTGIAFFAIVVLMLAGPSAMLHGRAVAAEHGDGHKHGGEYSEQSLKLTEAEIKEFGISIAVAGPGNIERHINLPGEIRLNADKVAHIVPQVSGVVRKIYKRLGDRVKTGELMAVLESRELADAKSAYFVAQERLALAQAILVREKKLWKKKISAERDYLKAKRDLAETSIELKTAEKKLHTLGVSEKALRKLSKESPMEFSRYEIRSPFAGTVIKKHITIGEMLMTNSKAFTVADLSNVWVNMNVYQKYIPFVAIGQKARISTAHGILQHDGTISYISPLVGEKTRTAIARVVLPNRDGRWKPGMFINAKVIIEEVPAKIMVPKSAIQTVEDKPTIFVLDAESGGFAPRHVTIGKSDDKSVEIVSSLKVGEKYVSRGAFILKAEMGKGEFGSDHE